MAPAYATNIAFVMLLNIFHLDLSHDFVLFISFLHSWVFCAKLEFCSFFSSFIREHRWSYLHSWCVCVRVRACRRTVFTWYVPCKVPTSRVTCSTTDRSCWSSWSSWYKRGGPKMMLPVNQKTNFSFSTHHWDFTPRVICGLWNAWGTLAPRWVLIAEMVFLRIWVSRKVLNHSNI